MRHDRLGVLINSCNPSIQEAEAEGLQIGN
jgi:hypothetical protein